MAFFHPLPSKALAIELVKARLQDAIVSQKYKWGITRLQGHPQASWENAALKTRQEWEQAAAQVKALGLPCRRDAPKNWDSLAALATILNNTDPTAAVLDAGAELYSAVLPWLRLYGYTHLTGINLTFDRPIKRGSIEYAYGDITHTQFAASSFAAISCLSVIEHGVDLSAYFREMARILKPQGILITSTDYRAIPLDTRGQVAYGVPIHIFSKDEILAAFALAREFDLELTGSVDLEHAEDPINWRKFALNYTFLTFTLRKQTRS